MQKKPSGDQGNQGEGEGEKERVDILGEARDGGQGELGGESLVMMGYCVIVDKEERLEHQIVIKNKIDFAYSRKKHMTTRCHRPSMAFLTAVVTIKDFARTLGKGQPMWRWVMVFLLKIVFILNIAFVFKYLGQ